jgi:NADH dehydrogenase (ubiquinone) Fe-S protein 3
LLIAAALRKVDLAEKSNLIEFGKYVAECLPRFVQKVQLASGNELEVLMSPEGIIPTLQFLKDHHAAQFTNLSDIAGMDVPARPYRVPIRGKLTTTHSYFACYLSSYWV